MWGSTEALAVGFGMSRQLRGSWSWGGGEGQQTRKSLRASQAHLPRQLRAEVTRPVGSTLVLSGHSNETVVPLPNTCPQGRGKALITEVVSLP